MNLINAISLWRMPSGLALLCLLFLSLPSVIDATSPSCVTVDGATPIQLADATGPVPVNLKLSYAPSSTVTVTISSLDLTFDKCTLQFTPSNWNVSQTVYVTPILSLVSGARSTTIDLRFQSTDSCGCKVQQIPVTRSCTPYGTCSSTGDPHYKSFQGRTYDHQGANTYYLIKSDDLDVMVITQSCGNSVTCNVAVAVRYGRSTAIMDFRNRASTDPNFRTISTNSDGLDMYVKSNQYIVELPDNTIISATPFTALTTTRKTIFVNVAITASPKYVNAVRGGMCTTNSNGIVVPRTGTTISTSSSANTWIVPSNENMFLGNFVPSTISPGAGCLFNVCPVIVPTCLPGRTTTSLRLTTATTKRTTSLSTYVPRITTTTTSKVTTRPSVTTTSAARPEPSDIPCEPREYCSRMLRMTDTCNKLVDTDRFYWSCVGDYMASDLLTFAQSAHVDYMQECNQAATRAARSPDTALKELGEMILKAAPFNDMDADEKCNNNGVLTLNGCSCRLGFGGLKCEIDLKKNFCGTTTTTCTAGTMTTSLVTETKGTIVMTRTVTTTDCPPPTPTKTKKKCPPKTVLA